MSRDMKHCTRGTCDYVIECVVLYIIILLLLYILLTHKEMATIFTQIYTMYIHAHTHDDYSDCGSVMMITRVMVLISFNIVSWSLNLG